ncbi:hypothetical protein OJJOAM_003274 [Cupriavidus sp. H18C1]
MIDNDKAVHRTAKRGAAIAAAVALAGMAVTAGSAIAQAEAPKYGGTVEIGSVYPTISALSWDLADWNWKQNYDTGQVYEHLFAADLSKAKRNGGKYAFQADAWLPEDAIRGELAESWKWTDPLTLEVKLRKGVKFPAKPGVMEERELVAEDVVFSYSRQEASAKKIPTYFDHLSKVEARDKHTVLFRFKEFNAEWDYRFGWGYYSGIMPKEVATAGAANWKNVNGTGPFTLTQFVQGNASTYTKNPQYWDSERIGNKDYKLPFVDKVVLRTIKDEATRNTMLRTGKLDIMEGLRWTAVDELKRSAPQLQWSRWLSYTGQYLALRVDTKPFNDIRVRRALNMAINKQEIVKQYYGGNAELFAYPQHPDYVGYYEPLSAMPDNVKGAVHLQPGQGTQAAGRGRLSEGLHLQGAGVRLQPGPYGAAAADRRLSRTDRRAHPDPADGVRRLPVGDDDQDQCARLHDEQWPYQPDHDDPQELRQRPGVERLAVERSEVRQARRGSLRAARRGQAAGGGARADARDRRAGAVYLAADAVRLYGLVAMGQELRRRAACRRGAARTDLRAAVDRSGDEEEDGLLSPTALPRPPTSADARRHLSPMPRCRRQTRPTRSKR